MKWFVKVYGYMPELFEAETADKARYKAFLQFRDVVTKLSFRDFIDLGVKVRKASDLEAEVHLG